MEDKHVVITITSVDDCLGDYGPQWKLLATVPFSHYPIPMWIDQSKFPDKPEKRAYDVVLTSRGLKKGVDASDAEVPFTHKWTIDSFKGVARGENPNDTPVPADAPATTDQRELGIRRAVALKAAVESCTNDPRAESYTAPEILLMAQAFDDWLRMGGSAPVEPTTRPPRRRTQKAAQEAMETGVEDESPERQYQE
jgi:hypothetical protein